jgi:hypothetical protein
MRTRHLVAIPLAALAVAGCGGEKSDVSGGVKAINQQLAAQGAQLSCPKQVDGGAGATFQCDLKGTRTGRSTQIKMKIVKEGGSLAVDFAGGRAEVQRALKKVTG